MSYFLDWLPDIITDFFRDRRSTKVWEKAYELAREEKYAEAAEVHVKHAPQALEESEFHYFSQCEYAFEYYIKAKDAENALEQARSFLRVLAANDGRLVKYNAGTEADDLLKMVTVLYGEGYIGEADALAGEVNEQLEKYGSLLRCVAVPARRNEFPAQCPQCAGKLPYLPNQTYIECSFCDTITYAR